MKVIIISLIGLGTLLFGGWSTAGQPAAQSQELEPTYGQVISVREIAGTWYGFPAGVMFKLNDDGSAHIGLDWNGTEIGYDARIWFESQKLSIQFTDYDGKNSGCASSVGQYSVKLHLNGNIRFEPVHDDCQFRMEVLGGAADSDFRVMYHPVQGW